MLHWRWFLVSQSSGCILPVTGLFVHCLSWVLIGFSEWSTCGKPLPTRWNNCHGNADQSWQLSSVTQICSPSSLHQWKDHAAQHVSFVCDSSLILQPTVSQCSCFFYRIYAISVKLSPVKQSSGIQCLEADSFKLYCFQTITGMYMYT